MTRMLLAAISGWGKSYLGQSTMEQNVKKSDHEGLIVLDFKDEYRGLAKAGYCSHAIVGPAEAEASVADWRAQLRGEPYIVLARLETMGPEAWRDACATIATAARRLDRDVLVAVDEACDLARGPVALVVTAVVQREGIAGLAGPPVVVGGTLVGATVTGALGIAGPDSWVSVTLLTESFSTLSPERAGAYPQLVGSVILVGLMAILIFPVGIGAAVFLEEYAPDAGPLGRLAQFLQVNISNLAGVPSVVYGLLGLGLFVNLLGQSRGLLVAASVTLGLLILPIVIVSAQEAIRSVPDSHRQASYGSGASRWQTVRNVVLPEAFPGILTGTILSLGRAIGETAPILLVGVATSKTSPPAGLFEKATALPLQVFASRSLPQPEYRYGVLAAAVIVLLALMLSMNAVAILLRNRYQRRD